VCPQPLPPRLDKIEAVAISKEDDNDIAIYRPGELTRALELAESTLIPFITIGAFAGLRHAEIKLSQKFHPREACSLTTPFRSGE
jgi:hypothetical protein